MAVPKFAWPQQAPAAVSFSWDDACASQLDAGLPLLDAMGFKASFYLNPGKMLPRAGDWKRALQAGHEMGNHTCSHPCSGNFDWSKGNAIEDYSLQRMEAEMLECNAEVLKHLGRAPSTFAYPCGQAYVGRGLGLQSTVPLVAKHFLAGRAYNTEHANVPEFCDLNLLGCQGLDGSSFEQAGQLVEKALQAGTWLIFAGHEIGPDGTGTRLAELEKLGRFLRQSGVWVDTVLTVRDWIVEKRAQ